MQQSTGQKKGSGHGQQSVETAIVNLHRKAIKHNYHVFVVAAPIGKFNRGQRTRHPVHLFSAANGAGTMYNRSKTLWNLWLDILREADTLLLARNEIEKKCTALKKRLHETAWDLDQRSLDFSALVSHHILQPELLDRKLSMRVARGAGQGNRRGVRGAGI